MMPKQAFLSRNPNGRILAIGELLVDFIPSEIGMKLSDGGTIIKTASGSSGIFACAAASFSQNAGFIGKIGKDSLSRFAFRVMKEQGVDMSRIVVSDEGQIGLAFIEYTPHGRNYQYYRENSVGSRLAAAELDTAYLAEAFALHYSGMLLELTPEMRDACRAAATAAKKGGALISFDPNIRKELVRGEGARKRLLEAVETADIIAPTLEEARFITQRDNPVEAIAALHQMGPRLIALTRDKDGAVLSCGGEMVWVDGIDIPAVDPTGAGDTFAAALVYCVQQGLTLEETARFCNCAGTCAIMRRGAVGMALPTLAQVMELETSGACHTRTTELRHNQ